MSFSNNYTSMRSFNLSLIVLVISALFLLPIANNGAFSTILEPDLIVAKDGSGNYTIISDAVAAAPSLSKSWFVIYIKAGVYEENLKVHHTKINIVFFGDGIGITIVTSNRSASEGLKTFETATVSILGHGFMAQNMTFRNSAGPSKEQAVALRSESDRSTFYKCSFEGYQDTLYVARNRQFYRQCDIFGTVDIIFGNATVIFQNCNLYAREPLPNQKITFTAQSRNNSNKESGISIHNCTIRATQELELSNMSFKSYLGRPWKPYSRTIIMQSRIDNLIDPAGWVEWSNSTSPLNELYYAEYKNWGAGAGTNDRVKWPGYKVIRDPNEAAKFTVNIFIQGDEWLPATGVPFIPGLI
ncbi:pectinesterase-like [Tasmannia lanceolata]|uniref:pectinesterase-like n=1 Tax=Tasmannia lanceolata TaxID=3420 RepID=UPI0040642193